ncbi:MAG: TetR/AcrR family transcriptional regulator [Promethearchaeota archaeon]|nr:MAG: TetR/AcrR family transcriptional regulator [Candidatus Lokiarchaeota archaeon]
MTTKREQNLQKLKREKKDLYILSAISVFEEKGFNNARVKDITNRAGTSVGNFYRYFDSKEAIFETIIDQFYSLMIEKLQKLQTYDVPPIDDVKILFREYIKIFSEKRKIALIFIEQMGGINKKYKKRKNKYLENFADEVKKIITKLVDLKVARIQHPHVTSRAWIATILGCFQWWLREGNELNSEELIDNLTNFLVKGTMSK